jgi:chromosome segregation ATPase
MKKCISYHQEHQEHEGNSALRAQAIFVIFVFFVASFIFAAPAHAQSLEDRLRDQLRAQMNQVQQLQDQQADLQVAKAAAEKERDDLKAQLAAAKAQLAHASRSTVDVQKEAELQAQVAQYKDAATQATGSVQQAQTDRDKVHKALDEIQKRLGVCEDRNAKLYKTGKDILDAYQNFDLGDAIGANEPLIGIKRVELENEAQGFDDRLHEGKYDPNAKLPSVAPAGSGH